MSQQIKQKKEYLHHTGGQEWMDKLNHIFKNVTNAKKPEKIQENQQLSSHLCHSAMSPIKGYTWTYLDLSKLHLQAKSTSCASQMHSLNMLN